MALFSKDGQNFVEVADDAPDFDKLAEAGYKAYSALSKDGQNYITLPVDEAVKSQTQLRDAGYLSQYEWKAQKEVQEKPTLKFSPLEAFGQGVTEKGLFGFSDELAAALSKGSYGKNLEAQRYIQKESSRQQPLAKGAGELTGALATGVLIPGGFVAKTSSEAAAAGMLSGGIKSALQTYGKAAAVGAAQSGLEAYGETEEKTLGGQAKDVATGAFIGAGLGAAGQALVKPEAAKQLAGEASELAGRVTEPVIQTAKTAVELGVSAGKAGAAEAQKYWPAGMIPGVGHTIMGGIFTKGAVTDLVENVRAGKQFSNFVKTLREDLGESAKNLNDSTIFNSYLIQPGDNAAKKFLADMIGKERNLKPDEITKLHKYFVEAPELSKASRRWDLAEHADEVATELKSVAKTAQEEASRYYNEAEKAFKPNFAKQDTGIQDEIANTLQLLDKKDFSGNAREAIETAFHELHDDTTRIGKLDLRTFGVQNQAEKYWEALSPEEQYDKYKLAREALDVAIPVQYGERAVPYKKWDKGQKEAKKLYDSITTRMNEVEGRVEANAPYAAWKRIQDLMENKDLFGKDYSASKIRSMLGDSQKGTTIQFNLQKLEDKLQEANLPESQVRPLLDTIEKLKGFKDAMVGQNDLAKTIRELKGLDETTLRRLDRVVGKGSLASEVIRTPGQYTAAQSGLQQEFEQLAQNLFQKPYTELNNKQQLKVIAEQLKGAKK